LGDGIPVRGRKGQRLQDQQIERAPDEVQLGIRHVTLAIAGPRPRFCIEIVCLESTPLRFLYIKGRRGATTVERVAGEFGQAGLFTAEQRTAIVDGARRAEPDLRI
jgi:hypothetical protein